MKSKGRYLSTPNGKVHYAIFKVWHNTYAIYTGTSMINIATGNSQKIATVSKLRDALQWVRNDIKEYEYREKAIV